MKITNKKIAIGCLVTTTIVIFGTLIFGLSHVSQGEFIDMCASSGEYWPNNAKEKCTQDYIIADALGQKAVKAEYEIYKNSRDEYECYLQNLNDSSICLETYGW